MARGGVRPGSGRPPGAATKRTREIADKAASEGLMPLDYMLQVMRDGSQPPDRRDWAAEKAAPYLHARLSSVDATTTVTADDPLTALLGRVAAVGGKVHDPSQS